MSNTGREEKDGYALPFHVPHDVIVDLLLWTLRSAVSVLLKRFKLIDGIY